MRSLQSPAPWHCHFPAVWPLLTAADQLVANATLYPGDFSSLAVNISGVITGYGVYNASLMNDAGVTLDSWANSAGAAQADFGGPDGGPTAEGVYGSIANYSVVVEVCPMGPVTNNPDGGGDDDGSGGGNTE